MNEKAESLMEKVISLCKRRGFIFPSSEIYGGIAGFWDYGPLGVELRHNIKQYFWDKFVSEREDIYPMSTSIISNPKVLEASGHVTNFGNELLQTKIGTGEEAIVSQLRPETAQGMFSNFKNIVDSFHPKLPFGMAQIGKAFRNEISPRDFLFRQREFEQMEIEYFVDPRDPEKIDEIFNMFYGEQQKFLQNIGLSQEKIHKIEVGEGDRAHYSKRSVDTEFDFPFGQKELLGLAYRTDFDLKAHSEKSGVDLSYYDEETKERFVPHCIEPTMGVDRLVLAVLTDAYTEDELGGEKRAYLRLAPLVAPVRAAVFPLLKNKPELVAKAREIYSMLKKEIPNIEFDDNGNIGKRYRRQDEIGTPHCITVDFGTLGEENPEQKDTVTLRDRDSGEQERVKISELLNLIK